MVNVSSILTMSTNNNFLNNNTMQYILTCPNGKQIDMSHDILLQMENKITRQDVLDRIEFYKLTNK